jgi:hypothetical protein
MGQRIDTKLPNMRSEPFLSASLVSVEDGHTEELI